jgi:hypothetical protein
VFQTGGDGAVSAVSPPRPFTLHAGEIILQPTFPPDNYTVTNTELPDTRFSWRTNLEGSLRFQVSAAPDFSRPVIDEIAAGESFRGRPLDDGTWYWRITAQAGGVSMRTAGRSFRVVPPAAAVPPDEPPPPRPSPPAAVAPAPLLPEALGRLPENGYIIGPAQLRESRIITFAWDPVPGADAYIFTLYKAEAGGRRLIQRWASVRNTRPLYDLSLLENGSFIWQVEAVGQEADGSVKQHGTAGENSFTVDIPVLRRNTANSPGILYGR